MLGPNEDTHLKGAVYCYEIEVPKMGAFLPSFNTFFRQVRGNAPYSRLENGCLAYSGHLGLSKCSKWRGRT